MDGKGEWQKPSKARRPKRLACVGEESHDKTGPMTLGAGSLDT